jgi:hypothetical protein
MVFVMETFFMVNTAGGQITRRHSFALHLANNRDQNTRLIGPSTFPHLPSSLITVDGGSMKQRQ